MLVPGAVRGRAIKSAGDSDGALGALEECDVKEEV